MNSRNILLFVIVAVSGFLLYDYFIAKKPIYKKQIESIIKGSGSDVGDVSTGDINAMLDKETLTDAPIPSPEQLNDLSLSQLQAKLRDLPTEQYIQAEYRDPLMQAIIAKQEQTKTVLTEEEIRRNQEQAEAEASRILTVQTGLPRTWLAMSESELLQLLQDRAIKYQSLANSSGTSKTDDATGITYYPMGF